MANLSATVSGNLKTALLNNSFGTYAAVEDTRTFYNGSTLYAAGSGSSGTFIAVSNAAPPRHFSTDDSSLVRGWESFELEGFLSRETVLENIAYESFNLGLSRRCTVTISGNDYVGEQLIGALGQEQADLECLAKAVIDYLDSL